MGALSVMGKRPSTRKKPKHPHGVPSFPPDSETAGTAPRDPSRMAEAISTSGMGPARDKGRVITYGPAPGKPLVDAGPARLAKFATPTGLKISKEDINEHPVGNYAGVVHWVRPAPLITRLHTPCLGRAWHLLLCDCLRADVEPIPPSGDLSPSPCTCRAQAHFDAAHPRCLVHFWCGWVLVHVCYSRGKCCCMSPSRFSRDRSCFPKPTHRQPLTPNLQPQTPNP